MHKAAMHTHPSNDHHLLLIVPEQFGKGPFPAHCLPGAGAGSCRLPVLCESVLRAQARHLPGLLVSEHERNSKCFSKLHLEKPVLVQGRSTTPVRKACRRP